jgi:hypothetical protein
VLAGTPEETLVVPQELPHVTSLMGFYTEQGVIARKERTREELLAEIAAAAGQRLRRDPGPPRPRTGPGVPRRRLGDIGWSWHTLLSNRPLDVWMHEQDIRRATDRPGHLDTVAARHRGRRLRPTARLRVEQEGRRVTRGERRRRADRHREPVRPSPSATTAVASPNATGRAPTPRCAWTSRPSWCSVVAAGRTESQHVEVLGDPDLGERLPPQVCA